MNFEKIIKISEEISSLKDLDSILDRILYEARKIANADAGSIFLKDDKEDKLIFRYVQNDTLFKDDFSKNRYIYLYTGSKIDITPDSIAGYCAYKREVVDIKDAYNIPRDAPYSFNKTFDEATKYRTRSILAVPLISSRGKLIGVMQIINAKDNSSVRPFSEEEKALILYFATTATISIERAKMTREMVLRMVKMLELRDPKETGTHVNRVASYSVEIFHRLAFDKNMGEKELKYYKDNLRIASMLHDVGKIAIPDSILKKPGKLTDEEYEYMKKHTIYGGELFENPASDLDEMSRDIALYHHERWDGRGYPYGKKEDEIPLAARIVSLADVYDALISKRVYKDAWKEEEVLKYIKEQKGKQFDPDVVDSFFSIYDIIEAIRKRYSD